MTGESSVSANGLAEVRELLVPRRIETASAAPRVLIVDNEPLIRWAIAETIGELGFSVVEAGDGCSALRMLADDAKPVDVVVLDYRLPDGHNLMLLSKIRRLAPNSPIIMMTAYGNPALTRSALGLGACAVMNKPFDMREIATAVQQALKTARN
jgi:DNA-binding NtrC family response regulator